MMKLEMHEVNIVLAMIENGTFQGKDVPIINKIIEKFQKEAIKQQEKNNGKK